MGHKECPVIRSIRAKMLLFLIAPVITILVVVGLIAFSGTKEVALDLIREIGRASCRERV